MRRAARAGVRRVEVLAADPHDDGAAVLAASPRIPLERVPDTEALPAEPDGDLAPLDGTSAEEVHRRGADEAGDEEVRRLVVEPLRRVDLLEHARLMTATRWPIVIASTWSCVT